MPLTRILLITSGGRELLENTSESTETKWFTPQLQSFHYSHLDGTELMTSSLDGTTHSTGISLASHLHALLDSSQSWRNIPDFSYGFQHGFQSSLLPQLDSLCWFSTSSMLHLPKWLLPFPTGFLASSNGGTISFSVAPMAGGLLSLGFGVTLQYSTLSGVFHSLWLWCSLVSFGYAYTFSRSSSGNSSGGTNSSGVSGGNPTVFSTMLWRGRSGWCGTFQVDSCGSSIGS